MKGIQEVLRSEQVYRSLQEGKQLPISLPDNTKQTTQFTLDNEHNFAINYDTEGNPFIYVDSKDKYRDKQEILRYIAELYDKISASDDILAVQDGSTLTIEHGKGDVLAEITSKYVE